MKAIRYDIYDIEYINTVVYLNTRVAEKDL